MECNIIHLPKKRTFKTEVDGYEASVVYRITDDCFDIVHTYVPVPIEGKGIAAALVKAAYDYAIENDLQPRATCPYAVMWLKRHGY
ncbi:N-acetyltransferase [Bacteroides sp. OttesenSCG-928-F21]|nr:N-acetyltransferase [Bacteroides sp. OttesenSCG-928-F21]